MKHAWYSKSSHRMRSIPMMLGYGSFYDGTARQVDSYGYLWYVKINGEEKLASHTGDNRDAVFWPDQVYLGEFEGEVERAVRADQVPVQE